MSNRTNRDSVLHNKHPVTGLLREQSVVLSKLQKETEKTQEHNDIMDEWHEVAFIMDRVFLFFYVFATVLTSIIFLAKMTGDDS